MRPKDDLTDPFAQSWEELKESEPGRRFQTLYRRRQKSDYPLLKKTFSMVSGLILLVAGILLLAMPGPGLVLIFIGAAMMAQCSYVAAQALDKAEFHVRKLLRRMKSVWHRSHFAFKTFVVSLCLFVVALPAIAGYHILF